MAQFDVYKNASKKTNAKFPYLLEIQSNLFEDSSRVVVIPLVLASAVTDKDSTLNPEYEIETLFVSLFPLDIASISFVSAKLIKDVDVLGFRQAAIT